MSEKIGNGEPAFPCASDHRYQKGMTLRDYFAAKVLQGLITKGTYTCVSMGLNRNNDYELLAYKVADRMIAARKEGA